ncbi:MAG: sulfite exporter TauE/SafE family protein [Thermodesulfovibrionales bacterium]|nr:sulfite exporter TauE/SafE family protein [Thermodesulfovibrionales bacterium]
MSFPRRVYEFLKEGSIAYAKWDYETSMNIIRNRKKFLILFVLLLPILLVIFAEAADIIGGKKAYAPAYYSTTLFFIATAIGLMAGLITGCIGAGGGFIITPALMAAGVKGIMAVGTDLFHIFAKAIMGTTVHKKLGNVSVGLAVAFVAGSTVIGATIGGYINRAVYNIDPSLSDAFISSVYVVLLGFLGFYALYDFLKLRKAGAVVSAHDGGEPVKGPVTTTGLALKLQALKVPPLIKFDEDYVAGGRRISAFIMLAGGTFVGFVAAIMGVGGGFVTFPMFVYVFGISTMTTVGTDILQIIFTAGYASIAQYAIYGFIFYTLAMGMLLGSLIGIQVGALTTKIVKGLHIRGFYAITILAGFANRATALPKKLGELGYIKISKPLASGIETVGFWLFWIAVAAFGVWVLSKFFGNLKRLKEE